MWSVREGRRERDDAKTRDDASPVASVVGSGSGARETSDRRGDVHTYGGLYREYVEGCMFA